MIPEVGIPDQERKRAAHGKMCETIEVKKTLDLIPDLLAEGASLDLTIKLLIKYFIPTQCAHNYSKAHLDALIAKIQNLNARELIKDIFIAGLKQIEDKRRLTFC